MKRLLIIYNKIMRNLSPKRYYSVKDFGAIGDGTFHPISEWIESGKFASLEEIQKHYPKAESLELDSIDDMAWELAKSQTPDHVPISIFFPTGKYIKQKSAWDIGRSNIHVFSDGLGAVTLDVAPFNKIDGAYGLTMNGNKVGVWTRTPWQQIDLFDLSYPTQGRDYLDLLDESNASKYFKGMIVFVRYGANYYNQDYGEHNRVTRIDGKCIYFERKFSRNYSEKTAPWRGKLLKEFTIEHPQRTFEVEVDVLPRNQNVLTIGSYSFELINVQGTTATLRNVYGYKIGTKVLKDTPVFKGYGIMNMYNSNGLNNGDVRENISMYGIISKGIRKGLVCDVAYNVSFKNCHFIRNTEGYQVGGGLSFEIDMSTKVSFVGCKFTAVQHQGSQISRSSGDIFFRYCTFDNAAPNFTEFNHNCEVVNSVISIKSGNRTHNDTGVGIGTSCTNIRVVGNTLYLENVHAGINHSDIQYFPHAANDGNIIVKNKFYMKDSGVGIALTGGNTLVEENEVYGGITSALFFAQRSQEKSGVQPIATIRNNKFIGELSRIMFIKSNVNIHNNRFIHVGKANNTSWGNLLTNTNYETENISLHSNVFENWYYQKNSGLRILSPVKESDDFSNNRFINCSNVDEDFVVDFKEYLV